MNGGIALREEEDGVAYIYYNCPINFIPKSVWDFCNIYDYYREFSSAPMPSIKDVSYKFWIAYKYFTSKTNEYSREKDK